MRLPPASFAPPSPDRRPSDADQHGQTAGNSSASQYRALGQSAAFDTERDEVIESLSMSRSVKSYPSWAARYQHSQTETASVPPAIPEVTETPTTKSDYWLKPSWDINGVKIPVHVMSADINMEDEGVSETKNSLKLLSEKLLTRLNNDKFSMAAVKNNVTEFRPDLRGKKAGGNRSTWDQIPCAHSSKTVVISAEGNHTGCYDSPLHEVFHGIDDTEADLLSSKPEFVAAYEADKDRIKSPYYLQTGERGTNGKQETFAEVGARYIAGDPTLQTELPNLHKYFEERYSEDRNFADAKKVEIGFQPTSQKYIARGGYKSMVVAPPQIPGTISYGSIDEYLSALNVAD